ncbi:uncharacterized protein LOC129349370 isoform X2 [Amphiprion ocellaris]|uniref:uncharacterized protein LOC129349370 isoform X2 n=1 Tax=Amphiprion ocellaris TaxID=80972 RepID=UPI002410C02C|nr:uncharacterized protein LOC129349370 isoform X2 [Amphiprion ocellaris]
MHPHAHPHVFTPILHTSSTILPAPTVMGTQDRNFNMQLPTQMTSRTSFAPVSAFKTPTQKSVKPPSRGRWGALHVCIAWKIHYHKQLKQMLQKPNSLHQENPVTSLPDSVQHKESQQPSCMHPYLDFSCGHNAFGNTCERSETGRINHNRSYPSDVRTPSPASCHSRATKREQPDQPPNLHWREKPDEKEKHRSCQTDTMKDLCLTEKSQDPKVTPDLVGRHSSSVYRKRQLECESFIKVKRAKQEILDNQFSGSKNLHSDQSPLITTHTHPASHIVQRQHMNLSDLSVLHPNSSRCSISFPVTELDPYKATSWDQMLDIHRRMDLRDRQNVLKDYSLNSCKVIRIPAAAQRQQNALYGFYAPPLYFPPALRQQEIVYLRGRETLASRDVSLPLQTSPPSSWHSGNVLPGTVNLKGLSDKKGEQILSQQQSLNNS